MQKCTCPADSVSKSDMAVSEVSGTPAVNGLSVVLLGRQKDRKHDQQCRRVSNKKISCTLQLDNGGKKVYILQTISMHSFLETLKFE